MVKNGTRQQGTGCRKGWLVLSCPFQRRPASPLNHLHGAVVRVGAHFIGCIVHLLRWKSKVPRCPVVCRILPVADPVPSMFLHYYMYYIEGAFARISPGTGHRDKKSRDAVRRHRGCKATGTGAALLQPPRLVFGRRSVLLHLSGFPLVSTSGVWSPRNLPPQIPFLSYSKYITFRRWCKGIPRRPSSRRRIWC